METDSFKNIKEAVNDIIHLLEKLSNTLKVCNHITKPFMHDWQVTQWQGVCYQVPRWLSKAPELVVKI